MNIRMTPRQSRILAIALLVMLIVAVLAALIGPAWSLHRRYDTIIEQQQDFLERYQRLVAQKPQVEAALEIVQKRDARRFFLKNTAANLAGAELQDIVRTAVQGNGGRITTSQTVAPKEDGAFNKISVNVQFFATIGSLQKVLNKIESQTPYLVVDSITMRPMNVSRNYKPMAGKEPEINVQIEVAAWAYLGKTEGEES
ncbi:MAG: type II secretion system protein M [Burkholderiales bacterium]|jgi:general secretion pathway protein M|nr:type II secretion system protein M [Burkholderiales bacterium]